MVWLGFFEKNVFLRTSGVRAKRISTFSVAKGLILFGSVLFRLQLGMILTCRMKLLLNQTSVRSFILFILYYTRKKDYFDILDQVILR